MQDNSSPQIKVAVTLLYPYPSSLIDAIPLETYDVPQNDPQFVCHPLKTDAITRGCPYSWFNLGKTIPNVRWPIEDTLLTFLYRAIKTQFIAR